MTEFQSYRDAVWSYLLEHSDTLPNGRLFVKFHADSRTSFENHILSRWAYGYHRGDPKKREADHIELRVAAIIGRERKEWAQRERRYKNRLRGRRMVRVRKILSNLGLGRYYELVKARIF